MVARILLIGTVCFVSAQASLPFELEGVVQHAVEVAAASSSGLQPPAKTKTDYLHWSADVAGFFVPFQDAATGAIIDPVQGEEIQYATPCFAYACLASAANGIGIAGLTVNDTAQRCAHAMDAAVNELQSGKCASDSCNFFTKPMMLTFRLARSRPDLVQPARVDGWASQLRQVDPFPTYHHFQQDNWGLVAVGGEFLRTQLGLNTNNSWWWQHELSQQVLDQPDSWTPNGQYQDHTGSSGLNPMPYDLFARSYLSVMLAEGYEGEHLAFLNDTGTRAVMVSLLMQSPKGEWPTGGRSSQHTWNEAVATMVFEIWSSRFAAAAAAGRVTTYGVSTAQLACMCKRAAQLSFASVMRWRNTTAASPDDFILKNRFPPQLRHGYEGYSFLSQYNLMPAAMVAAAANEYWSDSETCTAPADAGGFAFALPRFHKVIASAAGLYGEWETGSDPHYDSTGLTRIHSAGAQALLGPTAGPAWKDGALAVGPFWTYSPGCDSTVPQSDSLANATYETVTAATLTPSETPSNGSVTSFSLEYALVTRSVTVTEEVTIYSPETVPDGELPPIPSGFCDAGTVKMVVTVARDRPCERSGALPFAEAGVEFPAFLFDGQTNTTVSGDDQTGWALVQGPAQSGWGATQFIAPSPSDGAFTWTGLQPPFDVRTTRNGFVRRIAASFAPETSSPSFTLFVRSLQPVA